MEIKPENITGFKSDKLSDNLIRTVTIESFTTTFTVKILTIVINNEGIVTEVERTVQKLMLPNHVEEITEDPFAGAGIKELTFDEGITSIAKYTFMNSQINSINFPKKIREVIL